MDVCVLGSGSKGNCVYISFRGKAVLVDQGFSHAELVKRLESRGLDVSRIDGVIVSHEHSDHIAGAGVTARKLGIPVYATRGTLAGMARVLGGGERLIEIEGGRPFRVGEIEILPFTVSHDATEPVQFRISAGKCTVSMATDLGFVSTLVEQCLQSSDLVIVEANHDVEMLKQGTYPWQLKQRILGRTGHLSNRTAAELLFNLSRGAAPIAILAHLSEENNRADIAEREVRELFHTHDRRLRSLHIALQHEATELFEI
jgi:phosphoribosyl 1,2-cyclic phosphodiesterase